MKKVLTAVEIEGLNKYLDQFDELSMIDMDYRSQEELFKSLQDSKGKEAEYLIISSNLSGPQSKEELIDTVNELFEGKVFVLIRELDEPYINFLRDRRITDYFLITGDPSELAEKIIYDGISIQAKDDQVETRVETVESVEKVIIEKKCIAIVGPGGLGKTTMAINMADELKRLKHDVAVIDLSLEKADIVYANDDSKTGIQFKTGMEYLLKKNITVDNIKDAAVKKGGVDYFTGLENLIEMAEAEKKARLIVRMLKKMYDVVIIDTGNFSSDVTDFVLRESDQQIFMLNMAERNVMAVKKYLKLYEEMKVPLKPIAFSYFHVSNDLRIKDVEEAIGIPIAGSIEYHKKSYMACEQGKLLNRRKDKKAVKKLVSMMFNKRVVKK